MRKDIEYWRVDAQEVLRSLDASAEGLDVAEAARRLRDYGRNEVAVVGRRTTLDLLISQLTNPLVYVLVFAAAIAGLLGETTEAIIIVIIVFVNALLGFAQQYRSEKAVDELRRYISYRAFVLRDGKRQAIDTRELVPGDVVYLAIGDVVPADIRLMEADELQTNESVLTGESTSVEKGIQPIFYEKPLPHQLSNTLLMGSEVTNGTGMGVVVSTGKMTYFGRVATSLSLLPPRTDFQKNIASFGSFLVKVILLLTTFVFLVNSILGRGIFDSLLFSLALAVGIIPEALPVIITVGLSDGALRLVKKKVVVKRLEAIEDLGNVDVLCTDKTGTLTQNEMSVENMVDPEGHPKPELMKYFLLCNSAVLEGERVIGNPIDVAIWNYARKTGIEEASLKDCKQVHEIPFGFNRRRMSYVVEMDDWRTLISKGAPEAILAVSTSVSIDGKTRSLLEARRDLDSLMSEYTRLGLRLIGIGYKEIESKPDYSVADETGLTFIGLIVLSDPPKEDAAKAIARLKSLRIRLKILSGDDPVVTTEICRRLGMDIQGKVITGMELEDMKEEEFRKVVDEHDVYGRVTPEQKSAIVDALRKNGHVVGFLGDGVNDAPALRLADAGISVDSGVQVAKEASSILLLEKSLDVIADGVVEGRRAFGNMTKYIMNTTSANFGNMFTVAVGSLFLPFIPLLPSQILLINLLSDAPLLSISTDNLDQEGLLKPRKWQIGSIARFIGFFGLISSIFDMATISSLIYVLHADQEIFRTGWFMESVLSEIFVTFSIRTKRKFYESKPSNLMIIAAIAVSSITVLVIFSPIGSLFEFAKPPLWFFALMLGILAAYFLLVEVLKHIFFSRYEV